ncbi:N-6 DNA methylase [uncultured Thermomonospora sp.]|mgnify:FL=1|uniref:N-6 DNA methylase n=1 Tax=uncultured Thermomonospora sp. TaxID=671175 RepID=UPI00259B6178|nr:N-6 DNA methylase [uncultured Thermomonospora sp.]
MQDATVTAADIARLAGVGRAAVSNWRKRHDDFPQPVGGTATSPSFSLLEVQAWLRAQGKLAGAPADEQLWQELRRLADSTDELVDVLMFAGAFLLYLHRDRRGWRKLSRGTDEEIAAALPKAVRAAVADLPGERVLPAEPPSSCVTVAKGVAALARERGEQQAFEFLRERYLDLHKRRTQETPPQVVRLVAELAGPRIETVLDPTCGSGAFLAGMLAKGTRRRLLGQDVDEAVARLTAIWLALLDADADIRSGDSLRRDAFPGEQADLVVANPQFNDRNWGYDELTTDPRWEYGLPPRTESELAWVQHCLAHCRPGGLAVLLMPPAAAGRRAGRRIRANLLRRGALRAVITLPLGAVPNTAVPLTVWVLRRPVPDERPPSQVLMVDTSRSGEGFVETAGRLWRRFTDDPEADLDEPGEGRAVRIIDLLDDEVDLTPARHISRPTAAPAIDRVVKLREELVRLLDELAGMVPPVEPAQPGSVSVVTVADLARLNLLEICQASGRPSPEAAADRPVLTADDVVAGRPPTGGPDDQGLSGDQPVELRPGDVVVSTLLREAAATIVTEPGALLGRHLVLLRPDPARLDPDYLAGVLCTSANLRHHTSMSSGYRLDVRRAEIPLPSLEEQRRQGALFRRLRQIVAGLRRAGDLGAELARLIGDGLAEGTLRPVPAPGD